MMTKSVPRPVVQPEIFKTMLRDIVSPKHELILLQNAINWAEFETALAPVYCANNGRSSVPVRMMVALTILKYMYSLSDQAVLDRWCENPYWQSFCGGTFFEHEPPTDQATMSRWRSRVGEAGVQKMITETLSTAGKHNVAKKNKRVSTLS